MKNFVKKLLFKPEFAPAISATYGAVDFEPIVVETATNTSLVGLTTKAPLKQKGTILFFHGNAGCAATRAELVAPFYDLGFQVLVADYRGFGSNPGVPSEVTMVEDAEAFLLATTKLLKPLIVIGHSLGGAIAILALQKSKVKVAGLLTFGSVSSVEELMPRLLRYFLVDKFNAVEVAHEIDVPWSLLHGESDMLVPKNQSESLYARTRKGGLAKLQILKDTDHRFNAHISSPYVLQLTAESKI